MIFGQPAVYLNALMVMMLAFVIGLAGGSMLAGYLTRKAVAFTARHRALLLWKLAGLPFAGAAIAMLLMLALNYSAAASIQNRNSLLFHWHHPYHFELSSWHSLVLMAGAVLFIAVAANAWLKIHKSRACAQLLKSLAQDDKPYLLDTREPAALTIGFIHPRFYITRGLAGALEQKELEQVIRHEQAHIARKDPLKKLVFNLLTVFYPARVATRLRKMMALSREQMADELAIRNGGDRFLLAETLLKTTKLCRAANADDESRQSFVACGLVSNDVESRVRYLLQQQEHPRFSWRVSLLAVSAVLASCLFGVDVLHHAVEQVFHH